MQGGFTYTDTTRPCKGCGGATWNQHVTFRTCVGCGANVEMDGADFRARQAEERAARKRSRKRSKA